MRQAARAYRETQVTTTSQGQILLMLYDGAINFLTRAKDLMAAKDYAGKGKLISSAIDVINELASSLNAEKGGDLATNLNQLYFYCNKRLFMANSRMDPAAVDEVIKILGGLRSAYAQIVDTPEVQAAMAQAKPVTAPPMRTPLGVTSAPVGAPVPKTKAHNAYASQSGATTPQTAPVSVSEKTAEETGRNPAETPPAAAAPAGAASTESAAAPFPETPAANSPASLPDLPPLDMPEAPPTAFAPNKRLAASNLYRKFAS